MQKKYLENDVLQETSPSENKFTILSQVTKNIIPKYYNAPFSYGFHTSLKKPYIIAIPIISLTKSGSNAGLYLYYSRRRWFSLKSLFEYGTFASHLRFHPDFVSSIYIGVEPTF